MHKEDEHCKDSHLIFLGSFTMELLEVKSTLKELEKGFFVKEYPFTIFKSIDVNLIAWHSLVGWIDTIYTCINSMVAMSISSFRRE
jgi:hypothetical protein